ncbi:MAG: exodeoxyribonuclease VII small subunit [Chloroflexota bacterium]|nr:exodeoxyribonuclease VII small subunit [Chloroflexota bacterium]
MTEQLPPIEELTYEQAFTELNALIATLEADEGTLDEILAKFERGQKLTGHCADLLDKAELKVKQLSGDELIDFEQNR